MIKLATVLSSLVFAVNVYAVENWVNVTDSTDGEVRLFVDVDSFFPTKGDENKLFIAAMFRFVKHSEPAPSFAYVTDAMTCTQNGGQLFYREWEDGAWVTKKKFWWSRSGSKLFDSAGIALCEMLTINIREGAAKKTPEQKVY